MEKIGAGEDLTLSGTGGYPARPAGRLIGTLGVANADGLVPAETAFHPWKAAGHGAGSTLASVA